MHYAILYKGSEEFAVCGGSEGNTRVYQEMAYLLVAPQNQEREKLHKKRVLMAPSPPVPFLPQSPLPKLSQVLSL